MLCKLNSNFWNIIGELRKPIRDKLLTISQDIKNEIKEKFPEIKLKILSTIFTGSLTGLNYDIFSDIDLHFIVDLSTYDKTELELIKQLLSYYAKSFNENKFKIYKHTVEIYFQDEDEQHLSPGIYNIDKNEWDREPDCIKINYTENQKIEARKFKNKIDKLYELKFTEDDNVLFKRVKLLFNEIKEYRKKGLQSDKGMYSDENIVFKMLRRNGTLEELTQLLLAIRKHKYELQESKLQNQFITLYL